MRGESNVPRPEDYKWIKRWGQMMGSFATYIRDEQDRASRDRAPINAIYRGREGKWSVIEEVTNQLTRDYFLKRYPGDCPAAWSGGSGGE